MSWRARTRKTLRRLCNMSHLRRRLKSRKAAARLSTFLFERDGEVQSVSYGKDLYERSFWRRVRRLAQPPILIYCGERKWRKARQWWHSTPTKR